jgi:peptidoglycan/xylan/chitin deacetylase (PgdA/CDA1 family)
VPAAEDAPLLSITMDDLPVNGPDEPLADLQRMNDAILAAFTQAGVPAVGFVNEAKLYARKGEVDGRIALLDAWYKAGLELGNHTWSHPDYNVVGIAAYEDEIVRGENVTRLLATEHARPYRYFRHTFLRTGRDLEAKHALDACLKARGYVMAPVTVENDDWYFNNLYVKAKDKGDTALMGRLGEAYVTHWTTMFEWYESLSKELFGRRIDLVALMHENEINAVYLPRVLSLMKARGYRFATLEEALKDPAYQSEDRYAGPWGKSWMQRWALGRGQDTLGKEPDPPDWVMQLAR